MRRAALLVLVAAVLAAGGWLFWDRAAKEARSPVDPAATGDAATPAATPTATSPSDGDLAALIDQIRPIPDRPSPDGYQRSCSPGAACVFGTDWNDNNTMEFGRNGCDTRNDILARDLDDVVFKEGTRDCVVLSGVFVEPYTGQQVHFVRAETDIHIDHLVALSLAWDLGAHDWPLERRIDFANDPRNLLAADGPTNQSKGDQGPGTWLPVNAGFRCEYVERFAVVLLAWDLPLPETDLASMRHTAQSC